MNAYRPRLALLAAALFAAQPAAAPAQTGPGLPVQARGEVKSPEAGLLRAVAFEQNLDAQLPLDTEFRDEDGRPVKLGDYFGKKPVILTFVYFECPMLCKLELTGLVSNLKVLSMSAGQEFDIVSVSIDPTETPKLASAHKRGYLERYARPGAEKGWHFLTGGEASIKRLTGVAGFRYAYDEKSKTYAHPAGLVVATPGGKIARYVYGVDFPASNLRWSLVEASAGKIGTPVDRVLLTCFHYDPATGRYNFAVMTAVRALAAATLAGLASFVVVSHLRDRRAAPPEGVT
jgi:protein SCO1/2